MARRTKIVCTLGPVSSDRDTIRRLVLAGMDVARLNFSHGTHEEHANRIRIVRDVADEVGRSVTVMQDLQGPKIRVGVIKNGAVLLHKGQEVVLTSEALPLSDEFRVYVGYDGLSTDVAPGRKILLDDGLLELVVVRVAGNDVITEVVVGGPLRSRKGVHLPLMAKRSGSLLTDKDLGDLDFGLQQGVDVVALSFVRSETDVTELVGRIRDCGKRVSVIAKIEKPEAVDAFDQILDEADGIMVARGDLGIEMPLAQVPMIQKKVIGKCLGAAKPVITATQMLESMIENPRPTRAEASDVANAVLDGSDAVMLSGETAAGKYPVRTVEVMAEIIEEAEKQYAIRAGSIDHGLRSRSGNALVTDAVSLTAYRLAENVQATAICCLTATGATARSIARHRPDVPLYAFTDDERVVRQLGLLWGTHAYTIPFQWDTDMGVQAVHEVLRRNGHVRSGDRVVITAGMPLPEKGRTNMVHVSTIS